MAVFPKKKYRIHVTNPKTGKTQQLARYLMECFLERALHSSEHVHHKNFDALDNRLSNLQIVTASQHRKIHSIFENALRRKETLLRNGKDPGKHEICSVCHVITLKSDTIDVNNNPMCPTCATIEVKPRQRAYCAKYEKYYDRITRLRKTEKYRAYQQEYHKKYRQTPEFKAREKVYRERRKAKKKADDLRQRKLQLTS